MLQAIEHGKPVLVEKPVALELEDATRIVDAIKARGGSMHVGYSRRFKRRYLTMKEQLKLGRVGRVVGISARLYNSRAQVMQMLDRNPGATPVVDSLTYYVDLLGWYVPDNPVVEVSAWSQAGTIRARGFRATTSPSPCSSSPTARW